MILTFKIDSPVATSQKASRNGIELHPPSNIRETDVSYVKFSKFFKNACFQNGKCPIRVEKLHFMEVCKEFGKYAKCCRVPFTSQCKP